MAHFNHILKSSNFINILCLGYKKYYAFEQKCFNVLYCSKMYTLLKDISKIVGSCLKNSIFGRITELSLNDQEIADSSVLLNLLEKFTTDTKVRINFSYQRSTFFKTMYEERFKHVVNPLQTLSILLLVAIAVNIGISVLGGLRISWSGWTMRATVFSLAILVLYKNIEWHALREGSVFVRRMRR